MLKPVESVFFPISKAVEGHIIPGVLVRYPVRTVNYADYTSALRRTITKDPVTKFPDMNEDHAKGHPMMQQLRKLLGKSGPSLQKGYERMTEDLGWRGVQRRRAPMPGVEPVLHGPEVAGVLGAPPGLDL